MISPLISGLVVVVVVVVIFTEANDDLDGSYITDIASLPT
jgi:hypothetical protein